MSAVSFEPRTRWRMSAVGFEPRTRWRMSAVGFEPRNRWRMSAVSGEPRCRAEFCRVGLGTRGAKSGAYEHACERKQNGELNRTHAPSTEIRSDTGMRTRDAGILTSKKRVRGKRKGSETETGVVGIPTSRT